MELFGRNGTLCAAAAAVAAILAGEAGAGVVNSVQSGATPLGIAAYGPVMAAGSDAVADDFKNAFLPLFRQFMDDNLGETVELDSVESLRLNAAQLTLSHDSNVRAYFIGEVAGYQNSFGLLKPGFNFADADTVSSATASILFPNSSTNSGINPSRTPGAPLLPGDFIDAGIYAAGTRLDPFLIANGAAGGDQIYTTHPIVNPDQLDHVIAFAITNTPFVLLGFEDLFNGGDRDYNDLLIVLHMEGFSPSIEVGPEASIPTPAAFSGGLLLLGLAPLARRRM